MFEAKRDFRGRFIKGSMAYWKGKRFSKEYRSKLSLVHKKLQRVGKNIPPPRFGATPWNKGLSGFMAGEKNGNYKNGLSAEIQLPRKSTKYKNWRKAVFERDHYTCRKCYKKGGYLQAHHIKEWADYPKLRYMVSNGQTLCLRCHKEKTRRYMGLTKKDFKVEEKREFPKSIICTSWDDGGKLDLRIADLLKKYGLGGTFYITLDYIGKDSYMIWDDIKALDSKGFKIGSHTVSHPMDLKACYDEQLHLEIQNSKDMIEVALGHKIESFSYPRGRMDARVRAKVIEAGYLEARGTGKPGVTVVDDKFYLPGTIHIFQRQEYGELSIVEFAKKTINKVKAEGGYCNIWGHSNEIEKNNLWAVLEEVLKYAKR